MTHNAADNRQARLGMSWTAEFNSLRKRQRTHLILLGVILSIEIVHIVIGFL